MYYFFSVLVVQFTDFVSMLHNSSSAHWNNCWQVAEAANHAAFEAAVADVADWAEMNGFDNVGGVLFYQQEEFVKQPLQQWVLYR